MSNDPEVTASAGSAILSPDEIAAVYFDSALEEARSLVSRAEAMRNPIPQNALASELFAIGKGCLLRVAEGRFRLVEESVGFYARIQTNEPLLALELAMLKLDVAVYKLAGHVTACHRREVELAVRRHSGIPPMDGSTERRRAEVP